MLFYCGLTGPGVKFVTKQGQAKGWPIMGCGMERADFAGLRIMLLAGKSHGAMTLRSVLTIAGVIKLVLVDQSRRAIELLTMEHFDAVFAEECCDPVDAMTFPLAVRLPQAAVDGAWLAGDGPARFRAAS